MTLVDNYKVVLRKAWSMKFIVLSALFSAAEVSLPFFAPLGLVQPGTMAILALIASAGAGISRIIAQPKTLPND
jgi:hypothetical protein